MGKYISLGEYNKLYKYIWIYLSLKFITQFIFNKKLVFDQFHTKILDIPSSLFIPSQIYYIGYLIISIILKAIHKYRQKKELNKNKTQENFLIYDERDIETEYGIEMKDDYFIYVNLFFVMIADLVQEIIETIFSSILSFWMFELLFFEFFNYKFLNTKIYKHHIFCLVFIISSGSIINTICIILNFSYDTDEVKIFDNRKWLIPLGVIAYLLFHIFKAYLFCNEKYYFEKRFILISDYLIWYGIFGIIMTSICTFISTYISCGDNTLPELSKIICQYKDDNENYYFDSYIIYFKELAKEYLGWKLLMIIIKCILYYSSTYYSYVIFKKLTPVYYICMYRLTFLILFILAFINALANDKIQDINIVIEVLNILIIFFYLLGSIVYLEFIELNFCDLNLHTKRNIKERSNADIIISLGRVNSDIGE